MKISIHYSCFQETDLCPRVGTLQLTLMEMVLYVRQPSWLCELSAEVSGFCTPLQILGTCTFKAGVYKFASVIMSLWMGGRCFQDITLRTTPYEIILWSGAGDDGWCIWNSLSNRVEKAGAKDSLHVSTLLGQRPSRPDLMNLLWITSCLSDHHICLINRITW